MDSRRRSVIPAHWRRRLGRVARRSIGLVDATAWVTKETVAGRVGSWHMARTLYWLRAYKTGGFYHDIALTPRYSTESIGGARTNRPLRDPASAARLWELLPLPPLAGLSVVDIGPAEGFFALAAARAGAKVTAIHPPHETRATLVNTLARFFRVSDRLRLLTGWYPQTGANDVRYADVIFCLGLLYHLNDVCEGLEPMLSSRASVIFIEGMFDRDEAPLTVFDPKRHRENELIPARWLEETCTRAGWHVTWIPEWQAYVERPGNLRTTYGTRKLLVATRNPEAAGVTRERRAAPRPLPAPGEGVFTRRIRYYGLLLWHELNYAKKCAVDRYLTPDVQQKIPFLQHRLKITSATPISVVVPSGNRLANLKNTLPTYLSQQLSCPYEIVVSVYADREGTADYVRRHYAREIESGRLRVIDTPARVFNKARAVNIAVAGVTSPFLFLIDCDCEFTSPHALAGIVNHYNAYTYELASFSYQGQIMVRRDKFVELGGFDGDLRDQWAPDDADFIARYVAHFKEPYIQFGRLKYTRIIRIRGNHIRVLFMQSKNRRWINQIETRRVDVTDEVIHDNRYFQRIGGWRNQSDNDVLRSQIRYFLDHPPRVPYLTHTGPQS